MNCIDLCGQWSLTGKNEAGNPISLPASVPGHVHVDLMKAGILPNLFYRDNALSCRWVEYTDFSYERTFTLDTMPKESASILFEGLDTFAKVYVNGTLVAESQNMFLPVKADVLPALKQGENTLRVDFTAAGNAIKEYDYSGGLGGAFDNGRVRVRRMQCTYGWDWVDRFVSCGIYLPVRLILDEGMQIEELLVYTKFLDTEGAEISARFSLNQPTRDTIIKMRLFAPDGSEIWARRFCMMETVHVEPVSVAAPELWWPNGLGKQPLYRFAVSAYDKEGTLLCEKETTFGIRTVRIMQLSDRGNDTYQAINEEMKTIDNLKDAEKNEETSGYIYIINGKKVFCKGGNWVPCDPFPGRIKDEDYKELLQLAAQGNMNMLRIWGGGIYEREAFYQYCDEYGIMICQDFAMACGTYPTEDAFVDEIYREAAYHVKRLFNHPSIVCWTGDNECGMGGSDMEEFINRRLSFGGSGAACYHWDPSRPYMPSSPWGGIINNSPCNGTCHFTGWLDYYQRFIKNTDMTGYLDRWQRPLARFAPETPILHAPSVTSLRKFMTEEDIFGDDYAMWKFHTKNHPAQEFQDFGLTEISREFGIKVFGDPKDGEMRVAENQYTGYEWMRLCMESFRRNKWYTGGILFWMYNDCWPASGWSLVDYYKVPKAGYYAFKRAAMPLIASIDRRDGKYRVYLCNDSFEDMECTVTIFLQSTQFNKQSGIATLHAVAKANESTLVYETESAPVDSAAGDNHILMCQVESGVHYDRAFFLPMELPRKTAFENPVLSFKQNGNMVTVTCQKYAKCVILDGDGAFSDNFFDLLPGEEKTVRFYGKGDITVRSLYE